MKFSKENSFYYFLFSFLEIAYLTIFLIISFCLTLFVTPLHENLHGLACLAYGLEPVIHSTSVNCEGIQNAPNLVQFFYTMLPYIFWSFSLGILWIFHEKSKYLKYFALVPVMDVFINYLNSATIGGDFRQLAAYTIDSPLFFIIGCLIVLFVLLLTLELLKKTQVLDIRTFLEDFNIDLKIKRNA